MEISDYLTRQRVVIVTSTTKADVLAELAAVLAASDGGAKKQDIEKAIWQREEMMSTGIGHGLAIPHVRMKQLNATTMAVGVSKAGIDDYVSLDDRPVHILVLIAAPEGQHEIYIRLLAEVTEVLKQEPLRRAIVEADDAAGVYAILTGAKK